MFASFFFRDSGTLIFHIWTAPFLSQTKWIQVEHLKLCAPVGSLCVQEVGVHPPMRAVAQAPSMLFVRWGWVWWHLELS